MAVTPYSARADVQPLPREHWSLELRVEIAALESADPVVNGSVRVLLRRDQQVAEQKIVLTCQIRRHQPGRTIDPRIQLIEPVALVYPAGTIGQTAPAIYSERADFPRDLAHLNPVHEDSPSSPCVAREGTQALYDHGGVKAVIEELAKWLADTAAGRLEHDGWEPVPVSGYAQASLDASWFQQEAHALSAHGPCTLHGIADLVRVERAGRAVRVHIEVRTPGHSLPDLRSHHPAYRRLEKDEERLEIPWFFACGPRESPVSHRNADTVRDELGLVRIAELAGCKEQLRQYFERILPSFRADFQLRACIIIGVWRPYALIPDLPGLATGKPRRLELFACLVSLERRNEALAIHDVWQLRVVAAPTSSVLAKMAGLKQAPDPCAIVGCGALGSKIASFLVREGITRLSLVDPDALAPHNLARHELGRPSLGLYKAKELKRVYDQARGAERAATTFSCGARPVGVHELGGRDLEEALGNNIGWIIDATADRRAYARLCRNDQKRRVIRVEIADEGRLGLLYIEGQDRLPRIDDLEAALYLDALTNPALSAWLARNHRLGGVSIGMGCASPTMVMPDSLVALHAASIMPVINACLCGKDVHSGIGINLASPEGHPIGWSWVSVPSFIAMPLLPATGREHVWEIRIYPDALSHVQGEMRKQGSHETGGYLYGRFDVGRRTITVVAAFEVPALESSESMLVLPPAGDTPGERKLLDTCRETLMVVGSWHTHLTGNADMSPTDERQALVFAHDNTRTPRPMAMLILSPAGPKAYVVYPENW